MSDQVKRLADAYRSRGVLVDTNVLLLLFVGLFDRRLITSFKRTKKFTDDDYDLLSRFLTCFSRIVTTPNILSEVNSLSGQLGEPRRTAYFLDFARRIQPLDERYLPSSGIAEAECFPRLGLTDSGILQLAKDNYLVLTDDAKLSHYLADADVDSINFEHLRFIEWDLGRPK